MARELIAAAGDTTDRRSGELPRARHPDERPRPGHARQPRGVDGARSSSPRGAVFCTSCHNGAGPSRLDQPLGLDGAAAGLLGDRGVLFAGSRCARQPTPQQNVYYYTVGDRPAGTTRSTRRRGTRRTARRRTTRRSRPASRSSRRRSSKTPANPQGGAPANGEGYRAALARLVTADPQFARAARELSLEGALQGGDRGARGLLRSPAAGPARTRPPATWTIQPTHPEPPRRSSRRTTPGTATTCVTSSA